VTVCNVAIAVGAVVGGVLVDGVSASSPVLVGGVASIAGAAVLGTLRRQG
jgi:predicted MFS family arabinose efflux permease